MGKFCPQCGAPLAVEAANRLTDSRAGGAGASADESASRAVRRQLTVLFCDVVGSTELAESLDPEELRGVINAYHEASAAVIARYDGHIAQYMGNGLLVYSLVSYDMIGK